MKEINQYIQEKLIVNNTIQNSPTIEEIFKIFMDIIKNNPNIIFTQMMALKDLCYNFNKSNKLGLSAICVENYLRDGKNQLNLDLPSYTTSEVVKKYGNIFITNPQTKKVEFFIWFSSDMEYLNHYIKDFVENGYVFYYNRNYKKFKLDPIKLYTKQDILDLF